MKAVSRISRKIAVKNSLWKVLEAFLSKGVSMIVSIVLARLIAPEAYGIIALTTVFINFTDILIQSGFSTTLIRKNIVNESDYSTVMGLSLIVGSMLYFIIFLVAPFASKVFNTAELTSVLRVSSLILFIQAFTAVRTAVIARAMKFKILFLCTLISNIVAGGIGILFALEGFGVWALVIHRLCQQLLLTCLLFVFVRIRLKFNLSKQSIIEIVPPSLKILASSLLSFGGDSLYSLSIGKVYSVKELGFFEKGSLFPRSFALYTFSAVSHVFLPVFASYQDDYNSLNAIFRRVLNVAIYIILPMMAGLYMVADPLISVVLTEKWLPSLYILRWNCLYYLMTPIMLANVQLHFAIGRNTTRIKTELIRVILMTIALIILLIIRSTLNTIVGVLAILQIVIVIYIMAETHFATGYKCIDTIRDSFTSVISTLFMCFVIFLISQIILPKGLLLTIEIFSGVLIYWISSIVLKSSAYYECKKMVQELILKKVKNA